MDEVVGKRFGYTVTPVCEDEHYRDSAESSRCSSPRPLNRTESAEETQLGHGSLIPL